jgi:hypothetical protein
MPQKAKDESQQCCAFNSKDKRRCRLERESNKITCEIHKNYYKDWLQKHTKQISGGWAIMNPRERVEFVFQISNKYVKLTEYEISALTREQTGFYRLIMKYTDYSPLINGTCLNEVILQEIDYYTTVYHLHKQIEYLLKDVKSVFMILYILQMNLIHKSMGSVEKYFDLLTTFMSAENCRQILYSSYTTDLFNENKGFIKKYAPYFPEDDGLNCKWIRSFNKLHSKSIVDRMNIYKEELMAKAWHPKRVEAWLDAGLDIEDM